MDQYKTEKFRTEVREFLASQSLEELSYILGRYCGPSNQFLSDKKFGYVMPKDLVERELQTRAMEQDLFDVIEQDVLGSDNT